MSLRNALASCAVLAAIALAAPAFAQSDGGLETELGQGAGQQGTGQGQQGIQAQQGQQGQQPQIEETRYDDWTLQCQQSQGQRACRMVQAVSQGQSDQKIMQVVVGAPPNQGNPVATFVVPLGVNLTQQPTVKVDGAQVGQAVYVSCVRQGCVARMQVDRQALSAMRAGRQLQVTLTGQRGNSRDIAASLLGFTAAFNALSS